MSGIKTQVQDKQLFAKALSDFIDASFGNSASHGFWDGTPLPQVPAETCGSKIALMHSELSEMLEGVRKPAQDKHCPEFTNEEVELADLLIRAADYAGARNLRLAEAIFAKMRVNASRPYKHGKSI